MKTMSAVADVELPYLHLVTPIFGKKYCNALCAYAMARLLSYAALCRMMMILICRRKR